METMKKYGGNLYGMYVFAQIRIPENRKTSSRGMG